ncbi:MAG: glycosyltransferase, partial [bacterium]|nr:glycosyltransferase [bacterium]
NWAAKHATLITTYTESAKQELVKIFHIKPERIAISRLGIDHTHFQPSSDQVKKNYILYVGQAFLRRRSKETIEAFALIANDFPELELILVGQDKYRPPILADLIEKTNQQLGRQRIYHHSYIQSDADLLKLYQQAKLVIYLSSSEAMGLPPLEGLAAGTPALVKDNDLNREIYGENAFFSASETDPQIIAKAMANALQNIEKQKEILAHREEVIAKFNWSKIADEWLNELRTICRN